MLPRNIQSSDCISNPAAGYRDRVGTGALLAVGANGYVWSSSTFASGNINAGNMDWMEDRQRIAESIDRSGANRGLRHSG